jgi:hypothetical protein
MGYTFPMEQQKEADWCWNAVAVSVEHYFDPQSTLTQEHFAKQVLGKVIDEAFSLALALEDVNRYNGALGGAIRFADIQRQIDANLPVCVRIAWSEGGAHFVVISGYAISPAGDAQVYVSDPILRNGSVITWDYQSFVEAYSPTYAKGAAGAWADTYFVTP